MVEFPAELREKECRSRSAVFFYESGINIWQYYDFLRHFTLDELRDFRAIYGTSGGALCVWYYTLALRGIFDSSRVKTFDRELRRLNEQGLWSRLSSGALKPATYGRFKTGHFESGLLV